MPCESSQLPFVIVFSIIILLLLAFVFGLLAKLKKFQVAEAENRKAKETLNVFKSMSHIFSAAFRIDIAADTFEELIHNKIAQEYLNNMACAQEKLYQACNAFMSPEFIDEMVRFTDLSTLEERMEGKDAISCDYIGNVTGWCKAYFIIDDRDADGKIKHVFFAVRTIHDEKEKEESQNKNIAAALTAAKSANRAKSAFLFNMSHDIRTPMNALMGFTEFLEKNAGDKDKVIEYVQKIKASNATLLTLVNNVLEMARLESGKTIVEEEYWDIRQFNETLTSVFADSMAKHGLNFVRSTKITHHHILCDTTKVQKIFLNLLSNAMKFTPPGGAVKFVMTEIESDKDGYAIYRTVVEDNGIGISESYLNNIFEEFSKEHSSTESKIEGAGLGMAIVKNLVDFLNGEIQIESAVGKGTKITVTLPFKIASEKDIDAPLREAKELQERDFSNKRVLLAEDNELNAEIAMAILKEAGIIVDRAENGRECIQMLQDAAPDYYNAVLMDIQMPIMNGYEATREIRGMNDPRKAEIPVIAMTANAFDEDRRNSLIAGMNAHLAKPIDVQELFKTLNKFI